MYVCLLICMFVCHTHIATQKARRTDGKKDRRTYTDNQTCRQADREHAVCSHIALSSSSAKLICINIAFNRRRTVLISSLSSHL